MYNHKWTEYEGIVAKKAKSYKYRTKTLKKELPTNKTNLRTTERTKNVKNANHIGSEVLSFN